MRLSCDGATGQPVCHECGSCALVTRETPAVKGGGWTEPARSSPRSSSLIGVERSLHERMLKLAALCIVLALCSGGTAAADRAAVSSCAPTLANELASTRSARQLVTVVAPRRSSTRGTVRVWRKAGDCWLPVAGPWTGWLAERGVSDHHREGDHTTPTGAYGFDPVMYGVAPNPGVRYAYHHIVCGDWWVEDPRSPYYNRFRHVRCGARPPFRVTSEDLSRSPTA